MKIKVSEISNIALKDQILEFNIQEQEFISIPAYDSSLDKRPKFNRAKVKQETQKQIQQELDER